MQMKAVFRRAQQWLTKTPERALDQAYEAALMIQTLEAQYFGGNPISSSGSDYSQSAQNYFQGELKKYLNLIDLRMSEFRSSSFIVRTFDPRVMDFQVPASIDNGYGENLIDKPAIFFRKLRFVDDVVARYRPKPDISLDTPPEVSPALVPLNAQQSSLNGQLASTDSGLAKRQTLAARKQQSTVAIAPAAKIEPGESDQTRDGLSDRASFLPRSILRTVDRIKQDLDPKAEVEVVKNFRTSKVKTTIALKFILLLIIVPLLTQQASKNFLIGPVIDRLRSESEADAFLNFEMEEEALHELSRFEERLRFEVIIGKAPQLPERDIERSVQDKAIEIEETYRRRSAEAIKNVFADIVAAAAFVVLLINSKREVALLKSFIDEIVYGLSDSAKAFIIILFTDMFVGFHSPHGWEILLESLSRHLGLPANRDFIFLFIATFPVILDTVFKYWIFRYLNRISPSAVATYRNMNE
ncbi:MAG: proton extrusion protein PcxA [Leptolyngbyaceae cyanobacterium SM1_1_3]|nr:proton extrusion protein PcxA [Leptolyngbyaceae cyanobacterium SM1_1_3]NJO10693.1 proton extrusion protein PcxA [Leptolyngbyaceae cyanobacterium SL_1_1]